jgi:hypothetical protein
LVRTDGSPSVQQVEGVRALETVVIGGEHALALVRAQGLGLVHGEELEEHVHVGFFEVVVRPLDFALVVDIAISDLVVPAEIVDVIHTLEVHGDPLEAVSKLSGNKIQRDAASHLEVSELGDLHSVQPDLPTEP